MKDPFTLVCDLRVVQVWHRDKGGRDGACGWSYPQLTEQQRKACSTLGFWEARERHYLRYPFKTYTADVADRHVLYLALVMTVARVIQVKVSIEEASVITAEAFGVGGVEGLDGIFCFVPGYHSNNKEDRKEDREQHWSGICCSVAREILRRKRHWWQHPRWHVWHWRFHVPLLSKLFGWSGVN